MYSLPPGPTMVYLLSLLRYVNPKVRECWFPSHQISKFSNLNLKEGLRLNKIPRILLSFVYMYVFLNYRVFIVYISPINPSLLFKN